MTTSTITTQDVAVGDVRFHLSTSGDPASRPVLWLHGSGPGVTALTNWENLLAALAGDFYNLAPDVIGFGDSTHPDPPPQGIAAFTDLRVATLIALLDQLGIDQVDIVGNSMGAIVGMCLTLAHPQRVRRLVLMGAGGAPLPPTRGLVSLILFYDDPSVEAMSRLLTQFVSDSGVFGDQLMGIAAERMLRATRPEVERSHRATFAPTGGPLPITAETMATITHPVLLVHGDSDRIIDPQASRWYAAMLPNARLEIVKSAGHWLQFEHPDRFADLLRDFL
ncbi:alpha/beta fold hydrolase [Mycobacterium vicinigordonae]|uniref:Alpha/beta hydrolase n=1 Tax=Mycobacterium vicinigordonae TaxID=1719132 RepID=A0A7D6HY36_9MYCO|nr:alpha/beta hydrolase [Mycobacterium vicinigordonae]QLL07535.1 alpha/beta hydrolase [Mycobacterium vicinigordonae]